MIFDNDIDDDSENTFEDYGSDIESDSEDESGVISLVYEKMMSFCKTILIT